MRKCLLFLAAATLTTTMAFAQSSGNFAYGNSGSTHCVLSSNGQITGTTNCAAGSCFVNSDCSNLIGPAGQVATCVGGNPNTNTLGSCLFSCTGNGDCAPGQTCTGGVCTGGCTGSFSAGIKTNSGNGNVFLVRPSAVIGLLTDVSL